MTNDGDGWDARGQALPDVVVVGAVIDDVWPDGLWIQTRFADDGSEPWVGIATVGD